MTIIYRQRVRQSQSPKGKSLRRADLSLTRNIYADKESDRVRVELQMMSEFDKDKESN